MVTDDFSFPTIINPQRPNYAASTSLWRVPSAVFGDCFHEDDAAEENFDSNSRKEQDYSPTHKPKEEDYQRNNTKIKVLSTFKPEENFLTNSNEGTTEDYSTIKTDDDYQRKSSDEREDPAEFQTEENLPEKIASIINDAKRSAGSEEEKMDMLWENFNDVELSRVSSLKKREIGKLLGSDFDSNMNEEKVELSCVPGRISTSSLLSARRPNLLLILKVLKKLFLLQNAHCHKNNTPIDLF